MYMYLYVILRICLIEANRNSIALCVISVNGFCVRYFATLLYLKATSTPLRDSIHHIFKNLVLLYSSTILIIRRPLLPRPEFANFVAVLLSLLLMLRIPCTKIQKTRRRNRSKRYWRTRSKIYGIWVRLY